MPHVRSQECVGRRDAPEMALAADPADRPARYVRFDVRLGGGRGERDRERRHIRRPTGKRHHHPVRQGVRGARRRGSVLARRSSDVLGRLHRVRHCGAVRRPAVQLYGHRVGAGPAERINQAGRHDGRRERRRYRRRAHAARLLHAGCGARQRLGPLSRGGGQASELLRPGAEGRADLARGGRREWFEGRRHVHCGPSHRCRYHDGDDGPRHLRIRGR